MFQPITVTLLKPVVNRFLSIAKGALGEDLLAIAIFGSVARGHAKPTSDIDLLMVLRGGRKAPYEEFVQWLQSLRESDEYKTLELQGIRAKPSAIFFNEIKLQSHPWLLLDVQDCHEMLWDPYGILEKTLKDVRSQMHKLGSRKVMLDNGRWYWDLKPSWKPGDIVQL